VAGSNRSFLSFNVPEVVADCGSERIHCKHHRTDFKCGQLSGDYSAGYMGTELSAGAWYWNRNGSRAEYLDQLVCGAEISVFAPAEKRKEHIVSDEKNCKRSEKPVYFQNFRKNAVLHGQPDYFRFYRGRYGRTICKLLYDYAGDQQYSHDPCEYDPADGRRLFYRKKSSEKL